jgi:CBS domain-containing protein
MRKEDTGVVPIVHDPTTPERIGVVTDRDLCLAVVADGRDPRETPIGECMTSDVFRCHPGDDVSEVLTSLDRHRVRRLPVVDDQNRIVGMVSMADLVRHHAAPPERLVQVLEAVSTPRSGRTASAAF